MRAARVTTCTCDKCIRWPLSEVAPVARRWMAFELHRPYDVVIAHGPASWTETVDAHRDPRRGTRDGS
jgi:hypothetical protein